MKKSYTSGLKNNNKKIIIYEPIFQQIGDPNEPKKIYLMGICGLSEEEAREKIKNGWEFPKEDEF